MVAMQVASCLALLAAILAMAELSVSQFLAPPGASADKTPEANLQTSAASRSLEWWNTYDESTCGGMGLSAIFAPLTEAEAACGEASVTAFSDVLEQFGAVVTGNWDDINGWETAGTAVKAVGALVGVVLPSPVKLLSHALFTLVAGFIGGVEAAASPDNTQALLAVQKLFRHRFRSNQARNAALKREWGWYKNVFTKDFISKHGSTYEAAALSWLLNVQHDMAVDKELFFNADCLGVTNKNMFSNVSQGKCEDFGYHPISDVALCEVAASHTKGHGMDAESSAGRVNDESEKPQGCYWYADHGKPYLNSNTKSEKAADEVRQLLCTAIDTESQNMCAKWQESSSWKVSKWFAALHLSILLDVLQGYPALRRNTLPRIVDTVDKYKQLLTHSFKASVEQRLDFLTGPKAERSVKCAGGIRLTEGRDRWFKNVGPDDDDSKCRGQCDVMSQPRCQVRPVSGFGKYCVWQSKVATANGCWAEYKQELLQTMTAEFKRDMEKLDEFQSNATQAVLDLGR